MRRAGQSSSSARAMYWSLRGSNHGTPARSLLLMLRPAFDLTVLRVLAATLDDLQQMRIMTVEPDRVPLNGDTGTLCRICTKRSTRSPTPSVEPS